MRTAAKSAIESPHSKVQKHTSLDLSQTKIITGVYCRVSMNILEGVGAVEILQEPVLHYYGRYITVAVIVGFREIKERRETDGWCRMGTAPYPKRNRLENAFADCARVPSRSGDT